VLKLLDTRDRYECQDIFLITNAIVSIADARLRLPTEILLNRAGFKPIWPISSNRAPRQRGPRAPSNFPAQTCTFYRSCLCIVPARGPVALRDQNGSHIFQRSFKIQFKLALPPSSKNTKTLLYNHLGIQMKHLRSLKMSLQSARSNRKLWRGPQCFVSVASVVKENPSVLRGF